MTDTTAPTELAKSATFAPRILLDPMPIITLANGVRVGNFSSPHPFNFVTGEELPACTEKRSRELQLYVSEKVWPHPTLPKVEDIEVHYSLTPICIAEVKVAQSMDVDVILIPFPLLECMRRERLDLGKLRVIRVADRITKAIYSDRFCV